MTEETQLTPEQAIEYAEYLLNDEDAFNKRVNDFFDCNCEGNNWVSIQISAQSVNKTLKMMGLPLQEENEIITKMDTNKDGKIQKEEFAKFMRDLYTEILENNEEEEN